MDSLSADGTAAEAAAAGAVVHSVAVVRPELGVRRAKGQALWKSLWKSLFVNSGDVLVFVDADLTQWGTHFVTGLLGPPRAGPQVQLVKGLYDRVLDLGTGVSAEGGRVTELVALSLLAIHRPRSRWSRSRSRGSGRSGAGCSPTWRARPGTASSLPRCSTLRHASASMRLRRSISADARTPTRIFTTSGSWPPNSLSSRAAGSVT